MSDTSKPMNFLKMSAFRLKTFGKAVGPILQTEMLGLKEGPKANLALLPTVGRWAFTAARQVSYAAVCAPDRTALIDDEGELTYTELRDNAHAIARMLYLKGYGNKTRIGIMARNGRGFLYPLIAKGFIGAEVYFLNVGSSANQILESLDEHSIDVLFIDEEFIDYIPADFTGCEVICSWAADPENPQLPNPQWDTVYGLIENAPARSAVRMPLFPHKGQIVLMSSGTSGTPKGVRLHEPWLPLVVSSIIKEIPWRTRMVVQQTASMFHAWGWANLNLIFASRSTLVTQRIFDPQKAMEQIDRYKVNAIISSAIFLRGLTEVENPENYDHSHLEFIVNSGNAMTEKLVKQLIERFGPIVNNFYGSTEVTVATIANAQDIVEEPRTAGRVANGVLMALLDDDGNPVEQGEVGKIYIYNDMSLMGYTNPRDKVVRVNGLIEIGDRGYLDPQGRLFVVGRADDMIIVGGENIYPRAVDECVAQMPGVGDHYTKGVKDEDTFARLCVWVVREASPEGEALTEESVQQWVREHLQDASVPRDVIFADELPRNENGKVVPRLLPKK